MPARGRPRIERAMTSGGVEAGDALTQLREAFPGLMDNWITKAGDNPQMASSLLRLMENDIMRAQRGQADALLQRIHAIRRVGSPILTTIWNQAAHAAIRQGMEVGLASPEVDRR